MNSPPLAHVRRSPGRPRQTSAAPHDVAPVNGGERAGRSQTQPDAPALTPRLLDLTRTAQYPGVSPWNVRDLEATGTLRRVAIPLAGGRDLRKLLFDRMDLDRLVDVWKVPAA